MGKYSFENSIGGYSANYDKLLAKVLQEIDKEIFAIRSQIDRMPDKDALPYLLANRKAVLDRLRAKTATAFNQATAGAYQAAFDASDSLFSDIRSAGVPFLTTDLEVFKLVRQGALDELAYHANQDGQELFNSLLQYNLTGNRNALDRSIAGNLDQLRVAKYGDTLVETNLMTFSRTINGVRAMNAGVDRFLYDGPGPDKIIRPFCAEHLGEEYTLDEINGMDNGQTGDVFFTCGGFNCRHRWTPIQD